MDKPGAQPCYTRDELIFKLGVETEYAEKIWSAFGFAHLASHDKIFTDQDLEAFRVWAAGAALFPESDQIATARAIGLAMSRLADWQADQLLAYDRDPNVELTVDEMSRALSRVNRLVWRRHLAIALQRNTSVDSDTETPGWVVNVGFVDLVGYTSLSRRLDMSELNTLVSAFDEQISAEITGHGGQVVKTLGDGVLFVNPDAGATAATALAISALSGKAPLPELRIGLAHGTVLDRLGDVFGEPVNVASRLCSSARPGSILIDEALTDALGDDGRFRIRSIPTLSVRGYRRLRASALSPSRD